MRDATGALIRLRFAKSTASRQAAYASICEVVPGAWIARIGGQVRGRLHAFRSQAQARAAVREHYDAVLMRFLRRINGQAKEKEHA